MANCVTTSTFLKEILLPPTLNKPFNVFTGWKEDMKSAGYNTRNNTDNKRRE